MLEKPKPPLCRIIKEGVSNFCIKCGSTCQRSGFLGLFGEMLCHNKECSNSIKKYK